MSTMQSCERDRPFTAGACGQVNVGQLERVASVGVGAGLVLAALDGGLARMLVLGGTGAALIYRGWSGHCQLYDALGIDTAERNAGVPARTGVRVEHQVRIERSPAEVYAFWRRLENLPRFLNHLHDVEEGPDGVSHWVANGLLGVPVEWDARIINDRENELIAWESLPGSGLETAGSVHFQPADDGLATDVQVSLKYNSFLGKAGIALAQFLGEDAETKIKANLDELKYLLESGQATSQFRQHAG
jgi:uncharacterized membrane protein